MTDYWLQLQQAQSNQFDHHVHVEYEWRLRHDDLYDSDDDFDDRVIVTAVSADLIILYSCFFPDLHKKNTHK